MIHEYSYKPTAHFGYKGNESHDTTLTFGIENECDRNGRVTPNMSPSALSDLLDDASDRIYCKSDSSVSGGLELVTHPGSLAHHMYQLRWKQLLRLCVKAGYRSHDTRTAGLHVHVGRAPLGASDQERDDVIRKLTVLTYRHWDELVVFSRRRGSELDNWAPRPHISDPDNFDTWEALAEYAYDNIYTYEYDHQRRYTAVNVTNSDTVELRIFKGTLKRDTLIASLQLTSNMCHYAMEHTWEDVRTCSFLDVAHFAHFDELDAYLVVRGLDTDPVTVRRMPDFAGTDGLTPTHTA